MGEARIQVVVATYVISMRTMAALLALSVGASFGCKGDRGRLEDVPSRSGTDTPPGPKSPSPGVEARRPAGRTGAITGRVTLGGAAPEMPVLQRGSDAF